MAVTEAVELASVQSPHVPIQSGSGRKLRVLFCWAHISGYMASCWRRMASDPTIDLHVIALIPGASANVAFNDTVMAEIPSTLIPDEKLPGSTKVREIALAHKPDVIVLCGWHLPEFVNLANERAFADAKFIMGMDTPWNASIRQRYGRFARRSYFRRIDHVFCTGERSWQLAMALGFSEEKISRGVYGIDYAHLEPLCERRATQPGGWPHRWLYIGRYTEEKAIDVLVDSYREYRALIGTPWPMSTMGAGPDAKYFHGVEGIENLGFVQPKDQPTQLLRAGAFVLASRFDPWPLVVVESCAAGLPVVCTNACGSSVELVRSFFNGRTVATENPRALAEGMAWLHEAAMQDPGLLAEMGRRSRIFASAYSTDAWHARWTGTMRELVEARATIT